MSRARRLNRDGLFLPKTPPLQPDGYKFNIQTAEGVMTFVVPPDGVKACPECGCEVFRQAYRIAYAMPRGQVLVGQKVDPICLRVEVYLCEGCDRQIMPDDPTIADYKARQAAEEATMKDPPEATNGDGRVE